MDKKKDRLVRTDFSSELYEEPVNYIYRLSDEETNTIEKFLKVVKLDSNIKIEELDTTTIYVD